MKPLNRAQLTLFSDPCCHYSHWVRIVLAEKGVTCTVEEYTPQTVPAELAEVNPNGSLPTLLDQDLVLYDSRVVMEYLDERFPHPPLLPVYPVVRAQARLWMQRIERDWGPLIDRLMQGQDSGDDAKAMTENLLSLAQVFAEQDYFLSTELTLVDCCLAAILWRHKRMGLKLPKTRQGKVLIAYMKRLVQRESFQRSLSLCEQEMAAG
ncbi:MAG: glutathione S-transferase N-terminal domain-containing protein [Cellvibrionales bacterium]|nr:glutathione S-transferase N-terminal domain-containing protein [Cellvibrionales bacterium]